MIKVNKRRGKFAAASVLAAAGAAAAVIPVSSAAASTAAPARAASASSCWTTGVTWGVANRYGVALRTEPTTNPKASRVVTRVNPGHDYTMTCRTWGGGSYPYTVGGTTVWSHLWVKIRDHGRWYWSASTYWYMQ